MAQGTHLRTLIYCATGLLCLNINATVSVIVRGPDNTNAYVGSSVMLVCQTNSSDIEVIWKRNDTVLSTNESDVTIENSDNFSNLSINNVTVSDAGWYTCQEAGDSADESSAQLVVNETAIGVAFCLDWSGKQVADNAWFRPVGSDPCMKCQCRADDFTENPDMNVTESLVCLSAKCATPAGCTNYEPIKDVCCGYNCLDASLQEVMPTTTARTTAENNPTTMTTPTTQSRSNSATTTVATTWKETATMQTTTSRPQTTTTRATTSGLGTTSSQTTITLLQTTSTQATTSWPQTTSTQTTTSEPQTTPVQTTTPSSQPLTVGSGYCIDWQGVQVPDQQNFRPAGETDPCVSCICDAELFAQAAAPQFICVSVICAAPNCTNFEPVADQCCEYTCPEQGITTENSRNADITTVDSPQFDVEEAQADSDGDNSGVDIAVIVLSLGVAVMVVIFIGGLVYMIRKYKSVPHETGRDEEEETDGVERYNQPYREEATQQLEASEEPTTIQ